MSMNRRRLLFTTGAASLAVLAGVGTVSAAGPIAYWHMDEAAGATVAMDSVGTAHAVAGADALANPPVAGVAGILGNAWSFDASNDSALNVPAPDQTVFTTLGLPTGFTYSGWVKIDDASGANTIFSMSDAAAGSEEAALNADNGVLRFLSRHNTLDNIDIVGTTPIGDGLWHHVAVATSAAGTTLYMDGNVEGTSPYGSDPATFTTNMNNFAVNFGANNDNSAVLQWEYAGLIDEFSIYDYALSADDIAYIAANPGAVVPEPAGLMLLAVGIGCVSARRSS